MWAECWSIRWTARSRAFPRRDRPPKSHRKSKTSGNARRKRCVFRCAFSPKRKRLIAARRSRIFPSDDTGPGAQEAGVAIFIDRQLAGPWGRDRIATRTGRLMKAAPEEFGYQGKATPREIYRQGLKDLAGFDKLRPHEQDAKLKPIENPLFFKLLRRNTIEGMFCDPHARRECGHGGLAADRFPGPAHEQLWRYRQV